jgi:ech hydrogenase subunit F
MVEMIRSVLRRAFRRPVTRRYPAEPRVVMEGSRGAIDMDPDVCIYCGLCQRRCPANAIVVTRKPNSWTMDPHQCIVCGYCVEVCPKQCIRMETAYRPPSV